MQEIALVAPNGRTRGILFALCVVLPMVLMAITLVVARAPASSLAGTPDMASRLPVAAIASVLLFTVVIWFALDRLMRRHRLHVDAKRIEIVSTFYRRNLSLDALRLAEARVVDLDERTDLRPGLKSNAMATPGFRSGSFRLRNRDKAFVAMADGPRVVWIPTTEGYGLMLEVDQPQALLDRLRSATDSGGRAR